MPVEVIVPRIGWSMEKGVFSEWLRKDGDRVSPGDPLFTIEADKALEEVVSEDSGILSILPGRAKQGDELLVGTVIGHLLGVGEAAPTAGAAAPLPAADAAQEPTRPLAKGSAPRTAPRDTSAVRNIASPRARRVSRELSIDLTALSGTGRTGRIVERDVLLAARSRGPASGDVAARGGSTSSLGVDADVTELVGLIERMRHAEVDPARQMGRYRALLVKLAVCAYRGAFADGHVGACVDVAYGYQADGGIFYRSLREANRKTLAELAEDILAEARAASAPSGEEAFALVDLGAFGIDEYAPAGEIPGGILLCFGRLIGGSAQPLSRRSHSMRVSLSFREDRQSFAVAARFLDTVRSALKDPPLWLV